MSSKVTLKDKTNSGYPYLKLYSPYIIGTVGKDVKLTLKQKLQILFSPGISIVFIEEKLKNGK